MPTAARPDLPVPASTSKPSPPPPTRSRPSSISWSETADPAARALGGPYTLEVSSPGLERTLRTPAHFQRAIGTTVSVKTRGSETEGPQRRRGVVAAADDSGFELDIDGTRERLAYDDVVQTRTVFEWGAEQKVAP